MIETKEILLAAWAGRYGLNASKTWGCKGLEPCRCCSFWTWCSFKSFGSRKAHGATSATGGDVESVCGMWVLYGNGSRTWSQKACSSRYKGPQNWLFTWSFEVLRIRCKPVVSLSQQQKHPISERIYGDFLPDIEGHRHSDCWHTWCCVHRVLITATGCHGVCASCCIEVIVPRCIQVAQVLRNRMLWLLPVIIWDLEF